MGRHPLPYCLSHHPGGPLEAITILVITLPIFCPLVTSLGCSGLWFAVIMGVNIELALISPSED